MVYELSFDLTHFLSEFTQHCPKATGGNHFEYSEVHVLQ